MFGRKDGSRSPDKWIPIFYQIITSGSILNWDELISSSLDLQLKKYWKENQLFMSSYLLDVMCANIEYPYLGWRWEPNLLSVHVFCKMLWENKYKDDYEWICNVLFSTLYQVLFGEEAPCLSPKGKKIFKEYGDWYMTPDEVYIIIVGRTKPPHWFPHFVPDTLFLKEIAYQTYVNGVVASLHRKNKGILPLFRLSTKFCKIENFKLSKDEVGILTSYKFKKVTFRRHDPQGKLKEHLQ